MEKLKCDVRHRCERARTCRLRDLEYPEDARARAFLRGRLADVQMAEHRSRLTGREEERARRAHAAEEGVLRADVVN